MSNSTEAVNRPLGEDDIVAYGAILVALAHLAVAVQGRDLERSAGVVMALMSMAVGDLAIRYAGDGVDPEHIRGMVCENVRRGIYGRVMRDVAGSA